MLGPKDINKLDDYSYNRSSLEQRKELEHRIDNDPSFKEEAGVFFKIFDGFKGLEADAFQEQLNQWETKHQQVSTKTPKTKIIQLNNFFKYAAAAILLLAFLPLGYQYLGSGMSSAELFSDNFAPSKAINIYNSRAARGSSDNPYPFASDETIEEPETVQEEEDLDRAGIIAVLNKGITAYNNHQYAEATKYFETYISTAEDKDKQEIEFYLAVAYLAEGYVDQAKPLFEKMAKKGGKVRKADAEWYLVLSLLKENNVEQAQKNLNKIVKRKKAHPHKKKALKLQQQIDKHYSL